MTFSKVAESISAEDDVDSQALWRSIRAPMIARAGERGQAESMARQAVELLGESDATEMRADTLAELAAVLEICGRQQEACKVMDDAIGLYKVKGDIVSERRARSFRERIS